MITTTSRRLRLLSVTLLAAPAIALAQPPAPPATDPPVVQGPTFKSGVDLIRLDVIVVGKDGSPVADLNSEDFEVKVGGKTQTGGHLTVSVLAATSARRAVW